MASPEWQVPEVQQPKFLESGTSLSCAIGTGETALQCWGAPSLNLEDAYSLKEPAKVSIGARNLCAIEKDKLRCWGNNDFGQNFVPIGPVFGSE
jgi:hypothetical protein